MFDLFFVHKYLALLRHRFICVNVIYIRKIHAKNIFKLDLNLVLRERDFEMKKIMRNDYKLSRYSMSLKVSTNKF